MSSTRAGLARAQCQSQRFSAAQTRTAEAHGAEALNLAPWCSTLPQATRCLGVACPPAHPTLDRIGAWCVCVGCSDEVAVGASGKHGSVVARGACHRSVGQAPAGRGTRWCHHRGPAARASRAGGPPLVCHRVVEPNRVTAVHWDGAAAPACTAVGTLPGCDTHSGGTVSSRSSVGVVAAASVAAAAALAVASAQWFCKRARRSERRKARDG